jgi:hypothetical protein
VPQNFHRCFISCRPLGREDSYQKTRKRVVAFLKATGIFPLIKTFSIIGKRIIELYMCDATKEDVAQIIQEKGIQPVDNGRFKPWEFGIITNPEIRARAREAAASRLALVYYLAKERRLKETIIRDYDDIMIRRIQNKAEELSLKNTERLNERNNRNGEAFNASKFFLTDDYQEEERLSTELLDREQIEMERAETYPQEYWDRLQEEDTFNDRFTSPAYEPGMKQPRKTVGRLTTYMLENQKKYNSTVNQTYEI